MGTALIVVLLAFLAVGGGIILAIVVLNVMDDAKQRIEDQDMLREIRNRARTAYEK